MEFELISTFFLVDSKKNVFIINIFIYENIKFRLSHTKM